MTLIDYQVFWEISHLGSFAAAARKLNLTPSAISHAVSGMEEECGFSLFQRSKTGVTLTVGGRRLLPEVQKVLATEETLQQTLAELKGLQRGHVCLGCFNSVCTAWLPPVLQQFRQENPEITVEIYQGSYDDIRGWIKDGTVDFGFLSEDAAGDLDFEEMSRDQLVCVVPHNFATADPEFITVPEMDGCPFILQTPGLNAEIWDFIQRHKLHLNISCHVEDDQSSMALAEGGMGICVVPELVLKCFNRKIRFYPIRPAEYRVIGVATNLGTTLTPAARELMRCIRKHLKDA